MSMPHLKGKIRVARRGSGTTAVTTDAGDTAIGEAPATLEWINRRWWDGNRGDDFAFVPLPAMALTGLPPELFQILYVEPHKITVRYHGYTGNGEWKYFIHVVDDPAKTATRGITSDGSATIKNK
jgi:hypothetical protein